MQCWVLVCLTTREITLNTKQLRFRERINSSPLKPIYRSLFILHILKDRLPWKTTYFKRRFIYRLLHWKLTVAIMPTLPSPVAPEVVIRHAAMPLVTSKFGIRTTRGFQCKTMWASVPEAGDRLNIKMPSYQHRDSYVKDKTVSPTVLSLTWESPYLRKTVFILRRGPGSMDRDK